MMITVLLIGMLYALPNLYGEDPSIQITGLQGSEINPLTFDLVMNLLKKANIPSKSISIERGVLLARFNNSDLQFQARETIVTGLGDQYVVALTLAPATPTWLRALGGKPMKLGLDIRGGVHFLIEVDMETALAKLQEDYLNTFRNNLREQGIKSFTIRTVNNDGIEIRFMDDSERLKAESYLSLHYHNFDFTAGRNNILTVVIPDQLMRAARNYAISQNINIIRNRVNQLGIAEPLVQRQGTDIIVELPGIQDTARAKEILGTTATLSFRLVHVDSTALNSSNIPGDYEIKYTSNSEPVMLDKQVILTGDHINNATFAVDELGNPQVNLDLDPVGGSIMSNFTRNHQNKLMATLLVEYKDSGRKDPNGRTIFVKEEKVINVARITTLFGSRFRITGMSNPTEARQLSLLLRAGALMSPIKIVEEKIVGPQLGLQNIEQGIKASLASLLASILFMVIYYRIFGVIASSALLANLILLIGVMSLLPATLTIPGIAGIVLTLAVAVDANVLINERIKEELKNNRSVQQAIHEGYQGALSSICDANITTLITAIILYTVGTGSIKGFALTTALGIATSMFTAILGTRAIVNLLYGGKPIKKLSI